MGDEGVLGAPRADFFRNLETMNLPRAKFHAQNATDFADEAAAADSAELGIAVKTGDRAAILESYARERAKLTDLRAKLNQWNPKGESVWTNDAWVQLDPEPRPVMENLDMMALGNVPAEFSDYLQASAAWFSGNTNQARAFCETLLNLPASERHFRSTWAAFLLGRSWLNDDPEKSADYFQQVRQLKQSGFADSIGLAAASLGEQARALLHQNKFAEALKLYVAELATGDDSANKSLLLTCRKCLAAGADLTSIAADRETRRVMTAYFISRDHAFDDSPETNCVRWLEAVESANVKDLASAEQLALAAYQAGQWQFAQRWIERASESPTAQWLQAKLLLHAGKTRQAAAVLQNIAGLFPEELVNTNDLKGKGLEELLFMPSEDDQADVPARHQIQGEAGVLHLTRREYTQSLDALLRAGFWLDAAYVAERVLTAQELKNYVDADWPPASETETNDVMKTEREGIRSLLARRLARAGEFDAARAYYPAQQLTNYDNMVRSLDTANDESLPDEQRAAAFTTAAFIFRTNGMELLGTELAPDWGESGGTYSDYFGPTERRQETNSAITTAGAEELTRVKDKVDESLRFHYRYQAAGLAWKAASFMEDNTEAKARMLCTAGSWLKGRDPKAADYFYKALVRTCRKTAIGAQADRMRWFPEFDENGKLIPWKPQPPVETDGPTDRVGVCYVLNRGNTLQDVADTAREQYHIETSPAVLQQANPSVNINRLKVGQRIFVPKE
jgi:tetratricopeptide (TPR) repeat protein